MIAAAGINILECLREPSELEEEAYEAAELAQTARRKAIELGHSNAIADVIDALETAEAAHMLTGVCSPSTSFLISTRVR